MLMLPLEERSSIGKVRSIANALVHSSIRLVCAHAQLWNYRAQDHRGCCDKHEYARSHWRGLEFSEAIENKNTKTTPRFFFRSKFLQKNKRITIKKKCKKIPKTKINFTNKNNSLATAQKT